MKHSLTLGLAALALAGCSGLPPVPGTPTKDMSFFVTSANPGKGADLGGLDGADKHCRKLADAVGVGAKNWRAYLSTQPTANAPGINARDRIGKGPWKNANGVVVATSVADLHGAASNLNKKTAVNERGAVVNGRGDTPNLHDILTGSQPDGSFIAGSADTTCGNWTKSGDGAAMVGHHDRIGLDESVPAKSWNSSHPSRGCGAEALKSTGGAGLLYCFAAN